MVLTVLAIIPARSGSKGITGKNIKPFNGKPLISWTIEAAKNSLHLDHVVVSTNSAEIADVALSCGACVPFLRPENLATDSADSVSVVLHVLENMPKFEWLMLLQPTSPLRTTADIDGIFKFCSSQNSSSAVSVTTLRKPVQWIYSKDQNKKIKPFFGKHSSRSRRQDQKPLYALNGAIYLARTEWFLERRVFIDSGTLGYCMPQERSVDIDDEIDWVVGEYFAKRGYP